MPILICWFYIYDDTPISIKISYYGAFFAVENEVGYYTICEKYRDDWDNAISNFNKNVKSTKFKKINNLVSPVHPAGGMSGHVFFEFSNDDYFVTCSHMNRGVPVIELYNVAKHKYENNIRLAKYYYDDDVLELLYEDGTYLCWDIRLYTITKCISNVT